MKDERQDWKARLRDIIEGTHTPMGKLFDIILLIVILYSVIIVMLESVPRIDREYHDFLNISEWVVTILFSIEYIVRIIIARKARKYIFSFFGVVDLLSTIPKYLSLFLVGSQYFPALLAFRLLRVFRILKLVRYVGESNRLIRALRASRTKIFIFVFFMLIVAVLLGTLMYFIEGPENGFISIPHGVYWTIVTLTTVGYGDISPQTGVGQFLASLIMIIGYGIIAVPTGIVTSEFAKDSVKPRKSTEGKECVECHAVTKDPEAIFCNRCGCHLE